MSIHTICVYCGSSNETDPHYKETAFNLGKKLAESSIGLVYGGGSIGLMGAVADGALSKQGEVFGVIPEDLEKLELGHNNLTELFVVKNMHQRKKKMADLSDAFIALPGGIGTLEELFEVYTWKQLNFHEKPCAIYNDKGYYDSLIQFLKHSVHEGFLKQGHLDSIIIESDMEILLKKILTATHDRTIKW